MPTGISPDDDSVLVVEDNSTHHQEDNKMVAEIVTEEDIQTSTNPGILEFDIPCQTPPTPCHTSNNDTSINSTPFNDNPPPTHPTLETISETTQTDHFDIKNPSPELKYMQQYINLAFTTHLEPLKDQLNTVNHLLEPMKNMLMDYESFKAKTSNTLAQHSGRILVLEIDNELIKKDISSLKSQLSQHKLRSNVIPTLKEQFKEQYNSFATSINEINANLELEKDINSKKIAELKIMTTKNLNKNNSAINMPKQEEITKDILNLKSTNSLLTERIARYELTAIDYDNSSHNYQFTDIRSDIKSLQWKTRKLNLCQGR